MVCAKLRECSFFFHSPLDSATGLLLLSFPFFSPRKIQANAFLSLFMSSRRPPSFRTSLPRRNPLIVRHPPSSRFHLTPLPPSPLPFAQYPIRQGGSRSWCTFFPLLVTDPPPPFFSPSEGRPQKVVFLLPFYILLKG